MLSIDYGFSTSVRRSGHAACWCAALGGIVQFGGWPPSEQLSDVVRHEGSSCPLYFLPITTIARHLHRANQRRSVNAFEQEVAPRRQRRLSCLLGDTTDGSLRAPLNDASVASRSSGGGADASLADPVADGVGLLWTPSLSARAAVVEADAVSATTDDVSERGFVYDEGYHSEDGGSNRDDASGISSSSSSDTDDFSDDGDWTSRDARRGAPSPSIDAAASRSPVAFSSPSPHAPVVASSITVELLRQVAEETGDSMIYQNPDADDRREGEVAQVAEPTAATHMDVSQGPGSISHSTHTGYAASTLHGFNKNGQQGIDREAPPVRVDTQEVAGKHTVRPLRWQLLRPRIAPRTRHGHHLVCCSDRLYVLGGSYWAHGNALASTDMMYDLQRRVWQQVSSLFPPRFCAALARSNAVPQLKMTPSASDATTTVPAQLKRDDQVLYYFGGVNYAQELTDSLYRLWLPQETLEDLPQYGAIPRKQFKGLLVCDVQHERSPAERKAGERSIGRLFYMDGLQDGRPMAPYLRVYNLATGVWVRVCPSPDLVRSQVSLLRYETVKKDDVPEERAVATTRLARFEIVGGMPSRRGRQRRSRMCFSFSMALQRFDYSHAMPVPGLTAHCTVLIPTPDPATDKVTAYDMIVLADGVTTKSEYEAALSVVYRHYGVWSVCCGGNEDWNDAEQNSLGEPVGWLYLFSPRPIPLREAARVQMESLRMPMIVLAAAKDELLDELF